MKKRIFKVIIAVVLVFFTIACTLPFYFATAPVAEEKIVYVEITSTPEEDDESARKMKLKQRQLYLSTWTVRGRSGRDC